MRIGNLSALCAKIAKISENHENFLHFREFQDKSLVNLRIFDVFEHNGENCEQKLVFRVFPGDFLDVVEALVELLGKYEENMKKKAILFNFDVKS